MGFVGTEGSLAYDGLTGRLSVSGAFPPFDSWVHTAPRSMQGDPVAHVIGAMRGEHAPVATVDDAWRNLSSCLAFYEAARSGSVVAPEELPSD